MCACTHARTPRPQEFAGIDVRFGDVLDVASLKAVAFKDPVDVVVSCLASRTGACAGPARTARRRHVRRRTAGAARKKRPNTRRAARCSVGSQRLARTHARTQSPRKAHTARTHAGGIKDSRLIDYQATKNCLDAACASGASHFVLLSAICVQKPLLEFQRAKLQLEQELQARGLRVTACVRACATPSHTTRTHALTPQAASGITHSIVRPTAFFKSVAGQVQLVKEGKPYVMFGDGTLAACKPISEADLAAFISDCVVQKDKVRVIVWFYTIHCDEWLAL